VFTRPTKTLLVVAVLGLLLATVPTAPTPDDSRTYEAVAFEPETDADVLAHRSNAVTNLTSVATENETARRQLDRAVADGAVTVAGDSPLSRFENDTNYAVYGGEYYRLNASGETDGAYTFRLQPVAADRVVDELGVVYADASPEVRRVVEEGEATVTADVDDSDEIGTRVGVAFGFDVPSVVVRDGSYYVLSPADELAVVGGFFSFFLSLTLFPALQRLGVTYLCVAGGVIGLTQLRGRRDVLTPRRAAAVVGGLAVVQAVVVRVVQFPVGSAVSPTASAGEAFNTLVAGVLVTLPAVLSTLPVAGSLLVGVVWRRHGVGRRLAAACLGVVAALAVHAVAAGLFGQSVAPGVFAFVVDSVALVTAVPVVAVGYVHAAGSR
jgi:hypothetical protein